MNYTKPLRLFGIPFVLVSTHICLIALFTVVTYYPGLHSPFVFDDLKNIVTNIAVHPDTFSDIFNAFDSQISSSRPLAMLSFAFSFWTGKLDVYDYHVFNLTVHLANALVLYYCIVTLFSIPGTRINKSFSENEILNLAFWSAILWALNPVQHQAVTYIVQRMTSLATLFYLLSILSFLKYQAKQLPLVTTGVFISVFFVAGMACKEILITMPVSLVLIDVFLIKSGRTFNIKWVGVVVAVVISISWVYLSGNLHSVFEKFPYRDFSPYERVLTETRILWHYLSLLMFPLPERLHLDYNFDISYSIIQPLTTLFSLIGIMATLLTSWFLRNRFPVLSFALVFYFLTSSLEASFLNLELAFLHRLYLPSLFIFFGLLTCVPIVARKYMGLALIVIMALFSYATLERNYDWRSRANLWEIDYSREASPERSIANRGISSLELGRYDDTINLLGSVIDSLDENNRLIAYNALAMAHYYKDDYNHALLYFERIRNEGSVFALLLFYEGMIYLKLNKDKQFDKKIDKRIDALKQAYSQIPYFEILTAEKMRREGKPERAISILENAMVNTNQVYVNELILVRAYLADIFLETEQFDKAYKLYREITIVNPSAYFAWKQIYGMQVAADDLENAAIIKAMLESKGVLVSD